MLEAKKTVIGLAPQEPSEQRTIKLETMASKKKKIFLLFIVVCLGVLRAFMSV